ncbi:hypothetical protein [uncultured Bilophila sp.]|uniref:hypothetical protein n=1 Tax=uncultured Bilophila sp. TaxID=529385 RepID=UPI00280A4E11|nr:hypothetical protein [uncultured Bilophila sp.]
MEFVNKKVLKIPHTMDAYQSNAMTEPLLKKCRAWFQGPEANAEALDDGDRNRAAARAPSDMGHAASSLAMRFACKA